MKNPNYTPAEDALIQEHYPVATRQVILDALPGRTWRAVRIRANYLKVRRPVRPGTWSAADLAILHEQYPAHGAEVVAALVGRSVSRVYGMASELGIASLSRPSVRRPAKRRAKKKAAKRTKNPPVLKLQAQPEKPAVVAPAKRSPATPNLNAQMARKAAQKAAQEASKPKDYVSAEQIKNLPATHPARLAYTYAARQGMPAAQTAYHEAMSKLKPAA